MTDPAVKRRLSAVALAALFLSWGAVLASHSPSGGTHFPIAESTR